MTGFMTELALILLRLFHIEQRLEGAQFRLSSNNCRECHKTEVWLCFLILSFLSTSTHAAATATELQHCLKTLKHTIEKSDALLYAPSYDDIPENCKMTSLKCYVLELVVILLEEQVESKAADCILHINETLNFQVNCPPCEAQTVKNTTIFLERLRDFLQSMT